MKADMHAFAMLKKHIRVGHSLNLAAVRIAETLLTLVNIFESFRYSRKH